MRRYQRLSIVAALITAGCNFPIPMWPDLPDKGTCRNFRVTSWGGGAPWSEVTWNPKAPTLSDPEADVVWIDEPMLAAWGWKGDPNSAEDVCGAMGLGMVREKIAAKRAATPFAKVWLNWSYEELTMIADNCPGVPYGQGADIVSFDSYGGIWDWPWRTEYLLDMMWRQLEPGQQMGLVPEAHVCPECGVAWPIIDYVMLGSLYFNWGMEHNDERLYGLAPFLWQDYPGMVGMESNPQVAQFYSAIAVEYPPCQ